MLFTYAQMQAIQREVAESLIGSVLKRVEEVKEKTWVFYFEGAKLLICGRYPFCRFHLTKKRHASCHSPFADQLTKMLAGKTLIECQLVDEDRILGLAFEGGWQLIAEMMHKRPLIALLNPEQKIVACPYPLISASYIAPLPKKHDEEETQCTSEEIENDFAVREEAQVRKEHLDAVLAQERKIKRRIRAHVQELAEAAHYPEKEREVHLLQANYHLLKRGQKSIEVADWEGGRTTIALDPALSIEEQLKQRFKQIRKMKRRLVIGKELIAAFEKQLIEIEALKTKIAHAPLTELEAPKKSLPSKKEEAQRQKYKEFITESGLKIWVGKTDKDNDTLTFSIAHGNDLWFHAADFPGSHVVLKTEGQIDDAALKDAMQLALYFSKARGKGPQDVVFTECKYIQKQKSAPPGKVVLSKRQSRRVVPDETRLKRLLGDCLRKF